MPRQPILEKTFQISFSITMEQLNGKNNDNTWKDEIMNIYLTDELPK